MLNTFFDWLKREGFIPDNPVAHIKTPKIDHKVVQALTPNEIKRLLDACSCKSMLGVRNKAILSILLDTGLRVSELASLKLEDVDLNHKLLTSIYAALPWKLAYLSFVARPPRRECQP